VAMKICREEESRDIDDRHDATGTRLAYGDSEAQTALHNTKAAR